MKRPSDGDQKKKEVLPAFKTMDNASLNKKAIESVKHPNQVYMFEQMVGKGCQSAVWKFSLGEQIFACKITSMQWIYEERAGDPEYWRKRMLSLCREIVFLGLIKSPHVIHQEEVIRTEKNYYCILEYANGGCLQELLNQRERFPESVARECIR